MAISNQIWRSGVDSDPIERGYGSGILFPGFASGSLNRTEISAREGVKVVGNFVMELHGQQSKSTSNLIRDRLELNTVGPQVVF
jgi:hypothetical protein